VVAEKPDTKKSYVTALYPVSEALLNDHKALLAYCRGRATELAKRDYRWSHPNHRITSVSYGWGRESKYFSRPTPHVRVTVTGRRP
jgi:hypothetical protein